jgi:tetratricopeptide (TPR) repeat protein
VGENHYFAREYADALAPLDRAIELDRDHTFAPIYRGMALTELGRIEEALAALTRGTELDPASADGWVGMARLQLRLDPELVMAWRTKAEVLRTLDRPDEADTAERRGAELEAIQRA